MNQTQPIDIAQLPKQFCENIFTDFNGESFFLGIVVGANMSPYALTPEHTKRLANVLTEKVKAFEAQYRKIDENTKIPSPMQISDLGGSTPHKS